MTGTTSNFTLVLSILLLGILVRLAFWYSTDPYSDQFEEMQTQGDSIHYLAMARNLADKQTFSIDGETPAALWMPGYPAFLAVLAKFGIDSIKYILLVQVFVSSLIFIPYFLATQSLLSPRNRIILALMLALEPHLVVFSCVIMSEIWFLLIFSIGICSLIHWLSDQKGQWLLLSAIAIALSLWIRIAVVYIIPLLSFLVFLGTTESKKFGAITSTGYLLICILLVSPWLSRNYHHFGELSLSSGGGYNLLVNNISYIDAQTMGEPVQNVRSFNMQLAEQQAGLDQQASPFKLESAYLNLAKERIAEAPAHYLVGHMEEMLSVGFNLVELMQYIDSISRWSPFQRVEFQTTRRGERVHASAQVLNPVVFTFIKIYQLLLVLAYGGILLIPVYFFWKRSHNNAVIMLMLLTVCTYFLSISSGTAPSRFRVPVMPVLLVSVLVTFEILSSELGRRKSRNFLKDI